VDPHPLATPTLTPAHAPGPRTARTLAGCLAALWGLTILAALFVAATPALAANVRDMLALPLTATPGSAGEALDILTTNARVLGAIALAALSARHARPLVPALDLLVVTLAAGNATLVGAAIGAHGPPAAPWLAHLPIEWAALATGLTGYCQARRPTHLPAHTTGVLIALTAILLTLGAIVESFAVPALVGSVEPSK